MYCTHCGVEIAQGADICAKCAKPLKTGGTFCKYCGEALKGGQIFCSKCGKTIDKTNVPVKKKMPKWLIIIIVWVGLGSIVVRIVHMLEESEQNESVVSNYLQKASNEFYLGDTVYVGNLSYAIWSTERRNTIAYQRADSGFLIIHLSVKNNDRKARMIFPVKLIDQHGREYESSGVGMFMDNDISFLKTINPGVQVDGTIVFDAPRNDKYKLVVSGEFTSGKEATINLKKRPANPTTK
jgi:predicted nucleic acid-binding Zn ribbon protein